MTTKFRYSFVNICRRCKQEIGLCLTPKHSECGCPSSLFPDYAIYSIMSGNVYKEVIDYGDYVELIPFQEGE